MVLASGTLQLLPGNPYFSGCLAVCPHSSKLLGRKDFKNHPTAPLTPFSGFQPTLPITQELCANPRVLADADTHPHSKAPVFLFIIA